MNNINIKSHLPSVDNINRAEDSVNLPSALARADNYKNKVLYDFVKMTIDIVSAIIGLIVLSPILIFVILLLLIVQGRPIFIFNTRVGKNGALFPCIKFRTMVSNGDKVLAAFLQSHPEHRAEWLATRKLRDDPRVTPVGVVLRRSSIDEIPQLINILRGEMSLVGPRPIVPGEAELYGCHFADYQKVRPGLTGLWQVSGRSETSYSQRVALDVRYVAERSLVNDIKIIVKTVPAVLTAYGSF